MIALKQEQKREKMIIYNVNMTFDYDVKTVHR